MPKTPAQFEKIRADRKSTILNAALHVFAEEGYHSASISKVSKHAGVSKGLMYNYFESKEALLHQLLHHIMHEEIKILEYLTVSDFTNESLIALIDRTFDLLAADSKHWKLYFRMSLQSDVLQIIMSDYAEVLGKFNTRFSNFFREKFGENFHNEMQYFNTIFSGMKLSYVMQPETYPIESMKKKLVKQFII
ncbi:MAG: TetR/AcrR family transcriptional regulator [Crocinitomicaceae bacterium]